LLCSCACSPAPHRHVAALVLQLLPPELKGAAIELLPYLLDSFGNPTRIDYGTGHETTFVAFLYCLAALGLVTEADRQALVCVVFNRYVRGQGLGWS
jgi:serine/threonine-protein phosphatase 2A activator